MFGYELIYNNGLTTAHAHVLCIVPIEKYKQFLASPLVVSFQLLNVQVLKKERGVAVLFQFLRPFNFLLLTKSRIGPAPWAPSFTFFLSFG